MNTPIVDFVKKYTKNNMSRLHMPGHKGVSFFGVEPFDITEIKGADELFEAEGIIAESMNNASLLFDTSKTIYSVGGSTQSIHAMVYLAYINRQNLNSDYLLAGRNAHKSLIFAASKIDTNIEWLYPEENYSICDCKITADDVENYLKNTEVLPFAVYITSPDYLGNMADIKSISKACRKYHVPLLVDNAHGSYLKFCPTDMHPIALGADMCCDSAHKTLPALTGAGYLHIAKSDLYGFSENSLKAMGIFGSTSPSYIIMQSLDLCNEYLDSSIRNDIKNTIKKCEKISDALRKIGVCNVSEEPLKITCDFRNYYLENLSFADYFRQNGIECEYSDNEFVVFMITPQNSDNDFLKLYNAIMGLKNIKKREIFNFKFVKGEKIISIHNAIFSKCELVNIQDSVGRICGAPTVSCPPAIPIVISGEEITKDHLKLFKHYNIEKIMVLKEN